MNDLACTQRARCSTGAEVVSCTWNWAHEWPGAGTVGLANDVVWEFFSRHARHARPAEATVRR